MQYRSLGKSNLQVSALCLGTMMFGDQTNQTQAASIVADAHAHGVNYIDTAEVLSPLLNLLAAFLTGDVAVSLALFAKILFAIYLLSFVVDALVEHFVHRRDIGQAIERMLAKYWKELAGVLHDLFEATIFLPKLLWSRRHPPSE